MYDYKDFTITKKDNIATMMLNRPNKRNAISADMMDDMDRAFKELEQDPEVKVVILAGEGSSFSSGVDLYAHASEIEEHVPSEWIKHGEHFLRLGMTMFHFKKILICAIHGFSVGFGCDMAMISDFTIAAEGTILGFPENNRLSADMFMILPYITSMRNAKRILFLYERISAEEALEMDLINKIVPADKLMDEAWAMAERLAAVPSITLEQNKRSINHAYDLAGLREAFEYNIQTAALIEQSADPVARAERNAYILEHGVKAWLDSLKK